MKIHLSILTLLFILLNSCSTTQIKYRELDMQQSKTSLEMSYEKFQGKDEFLLECNGYSTIDFGGISTKGKLIVKVIEMNTGQLLKSHIVTNENSISNLTIKGLNTPKYLFKIESEMSENGFFKVKCIK